MSPRKHNVVKSTIGLVNSVFGRIDRVFGVWVTGKGIWINVLVRKGTSNDECILDY